MLQSCPILCDSMDSSPPGSSVHGILQARRLEGVPFPTPEDLPDSGIKPVFPAAPALAGRFFTISATWEVFYLYSCLNRYVCTVCVCVCARTRACTDWRELFPFGVGSVCWPCGILAVSCKWWMNRTGPLLEEGELQRQQEEWRRTSLLFDFTFTALTWSSTMAELLRDAMCSLSVEWNGVSLGTLMQLKRASFPISMFCTDTTQDQMPSKLINFRNCEGDIKGEFDLYRGFPRWLSGKESACQYRRLRKWGLDPWVGKIPWRRKWQPTPLYSCLVNPTDRGAWRATVHEVTESQTRLSNWAHRHDLYRNYPI